MKARSSERTHPLALVVDDDRNTRILVRECLEQAGFLVEEADDGEEAVRVYEHIHPDVVLLDVIMPKLDGFAACKRIRNLQDGQHTPILMMTGLDDEESIQRAYEAGATDFTSKPVNWFVLPHRIRYLLRASRAIVELSKAYEELKSLDRAKDVFLSSVSHELRTPLTSIRSFAEILLTYGDTDPGERKEFLGIIRSESERLTRLIDNVLDIARIESKKMIWKDSLLSLGEAVAAVAMAQKLLLEARSLRLFTHIPEGLPPLFADRDRIQQVITNLLSNAIKFSPAGREIRIWAKPLEGKRSGDRADWLLVGVSDQGVGIAAQDQEAVFKKFKQVCTDTLTDKPEGSGLGLPICKEIVAHYGGNIWVESKKGEGSTFFFTLPSASPSQRTGLASKSATSHTQREEKGDHACGE